MFLLDCIKNQPGKRNLCGHVKQSKENKTWKRSLPIVQSILTGINSWIRSMSWICNVGYKVNPLELDTLDKNPLKKKPQ